MASQLLSDIGSSLKQPHSFLKDLKSTVISHTPFVGGHSMNNMSSSTTNNDSSDSTITYNNDILTLSRVNQIDHKLKSDDDVPTVEEMKELLEPFCDFDFSDMHYVNTILDKTKYDKRIEKRLLRFDKSIQKVFKGFDLNSTNSQNLRQEMIDSFEMNDDLDDDLDGMNESGALSLDYSTTMNTTTTMSTTTMSTTTITSINKLLNPALAGKKLVKGAMDAGKRFAKEVTEAGQEGK